MIELTLEQYDKLVKAYHNGEWKFMNDQPWYLRYTWKGLDIHYSGPDVTVFYKGELLIPPEGKDLKRDTFSVTEYRKDRAIERDLEEVFND